MPPNTAPYPTGQPVPAPHHKGASKLPVILLVVFIVLFIAAAVFAVWAYGGMTDYKTNVDQKVADAVVIAKQETSTQKDNEFVEKYKNPYSTYKGPDTYGGVQIQYPRTWSAYIDEKGTGTNVVDGYMHPAFVPGLNSGTAFALRLEIVNQSYDQQVKQFDSKVKTGKVKVSPYKAKQVPSVVGTRVEGEINTGQTDYMVLFPIRDKTLRVSTQSTNFVGDFDNIILANIKFTP